MSAQSFLENLQKAAEGRFFRKSKIEDHKSKFELWDTVYVMDDNKIVEARICEINIQIIPMPTTSKLTRVKYHLTKLRTDELNASNYAQSFLEVDESDCFASKDELIQNLKGD